MSFSITGVQTDTDINLDGLSSVTGHSVKTSGNNGYTLNEHIFDSEITIDVQGDLTISPELENVTCSYLIVRSGAILRLDGKIINNGSISRYSDRLAIWCDNYSTTASSDFSIILEDGATIIHEGGIIRIQGSIQSRSCTYEHAGAIIEQQKNGDNQWRQQGTTFSLTADIPSDYFGIQLRANQFTLIGVEVPPRIQPLGMTRAFGFSTGTPNQDILFEEPNLLDDSTEVHFALWSGCRPIIRNGFYKTIRVGGNNTTSNSYGIVDVQMDVTITSSDLWMNSLNPRIYRLAPVKGQSISYDKEGYVFDGTSTIEINRLVSEGSFSYRTRINGTNTGSSDDPNTGVYSWGFYGDSDTESGSLSHTFRLRLYGQVENTITITEGNGEVISNLPMLPNSLISATESEAIVYLDSLVIDKENKIVTTLETDDIKIYTALDYWFALEENQDTINFTTLIDGVISFSNDWVLDRPNTLTVNDVDGDSVIVFVRDYDTEDTIYEKTDSVNHNIDVSSNESVLISFYKRGHFIKTERIFTPYNTSYTVNLTPIPFYDFDLDVDYISSTITSSIVDGVVKNFFNTDFGIRLPQGHMRQALADLQASSSFIEFINNRGIESGNDGEKLFSSDAYGFTIKRPVITFEINGDFNILSDDFVNDEGSIFNDGEQPNFIYNPENSENRSFQGTPYEIILSSNLAIDETISINNNLEIINNGIKKSSLLIPHNTDLDI